jgi:DNA-directed RNA polymerase subunit RPC12/RpoP
MRPSPAALSAADALDRREFICPGWKAGVECGTKVTTIATLGRPVSRCRECRVRRLLAQQKRASRKYANKNK